MIVDDPSIGILEDNVIYKPCGTSCKHLSYEGLKAKCAIHNEDWCKETPCFEFTQIESKNSNCRMGEFVLKDKR